MVGWRVVSRVAGSLQPGSYIVSIEEKELIHTVWKHFAIAGEWPSVQRVQSDLHRTGDVRLIAKRTGSEMVFCDWSNEGTCRLSLAAVALCDGSEDLVELYLRAVRYFASRYVEDQVSRIDSRNLAAALELDELTQKKLRCVIGEERYFVSISGRAGLEYTVDFTPSVVFFGDVKSLAEYLATLEKTRSDSLEAAGQPMSPTSVEREQRELSLPTRIFLVHGHDEALLESVSRFLKSLGVPPVILHEQPNRGHHILEKLVDHSDVGFAVVLLTGDDVGGTRDVRSADLALRARQNVILEFGFFLAKLGRRRVCALYDEGVEIPSDYHGIVYVKRDAAGAWKHGLARELKAAGFDVDIDKLL